MILAEVAPHLDLLLPAAAAAMALVLARPRWNGSTAALLRNAALVQAFLVLVPQLVWLGTRQRPPLLYLAFAPLFMFFGLGAFALTEPRRSLPS
jgi:hypothetical protein